MVVVPYKFWLQAAVGFPGLVSRSSWLTSLWMLFRANFGETFWGACLWVRLLPLPTIPGWGLCCGCCLHVLPVPRDSGLVFVVCVFVCGFRLQLANPR